MRLGWRGIVGVGLLMMGRMGFAQTLQIGNTNAGDPGNSWEMSRYAQAQAFQTTHPFTATSVLFGTFYAGQSDSPTAGASGYFDWTIYTDNGGTPGQAISSGRADQHFTPDSYGRAQWTFDLPNVALNGNSLYWFAMHNTDASGAYQSANLYWTGDIFGPYGTVPGSQAYDPTTGVWMPNPATDADYFGYGNHLTLAIYGNETTTPEPSTLALFGTGVVGLVPLVRRRRAR